MAVRRYIFPDIEYSNAKKKCPTMPDNTAFNIRECETFSVNDVMKGLL